MQRLTPPTSLVCFLLALLLSSCSSGRRWANEPEIATAEGGKRRLIDDRAAASDPGKDGSVQNIGPDTDAPLRETEYADSDGKRPVLQLKGERRPDDGPVDGKLLGVFRNTYYDFPSEADYSGAPAPIMNAQCKKIRDVPTGFFEAVCVQGSGTLATGTTVSFSKRNCGCARTCSRTGQKICFDELPRAEFPWGRGALGKPITPLRTIAVDSDVIPLGTPVYILEYDGVPRKPGGAPHDGCFVAEDRGMKVQGEHVDVFTGNVNVTKHFNSVVPSNAGVHVYVGTARCQ